MVTRAASSSFSPGSIRRHQDPPGPCRRYEALKDQLRQRYEADLQAVILGLQKDWRSPAAGKNRFFEAGLFCPLPFLSQKLQPARIQGFI